jgi:hypothetical protein
VRTASAIAAQPRLIRPGTMGRGRGIVFPRRGMSPPPSTCSSAPPQMVSMSAASITPLNWYASSHTSGAVLQSEARTVRVAAAARLGRPHRAFGSALTC